MHASVTFFNNEKETLVNIYISANQALKEALRGNNEDLIRACREYKKEIFDIAIKEGLNLSEIFKNL